MTETCTRALLDMKWIHSKKNVWTSDSGYSAVVGANLWVQHSLEVNGNGTEGGRTAGKETFTVHTRNIISQRQYFIAQPQFVCRCLWMTKYLSLFSFYLQASDVRDTHSLGQSTIQTFQQLLGKSLMHTIMTSKHAHNFSVQEHNTSANGQNSNSELVASLRDKI